VSDRHAQRREMLLRTAKSCGPDAPALASSWRKHVGPTGLRCALSASDGDNKPITEESTKETVKTIACGSAGLIRWTCGDYTRVLFTLRTRLRVHWASGVPHALRGGLFSCTTRAHCAAGMRSCVLSWLFEISSNETTTLSSLRTCSQERLGLVSHYCEDRRLRHVNLTVTSFVYALQTISRAPAPA
jgi:hypothetical protein